MTALTYNDVLESYAEYPAPIRPYLVRAETHPGLRTALTKSFMRVVIDVLARAPLADPSRGLQLRIDVIADKLGLSDKTVSRALCVLKSKGWLLRLPGTDGRNYCGRFRSEEYVLGEELRAILGMPTAQPAPSPAPEDSEDRGTADGHENVVEATETELSAGVYIGVNKIFKKEASLRIEASQKATSKTFVVPRDLVGMATELAIRPEGMGKLLRAAKTAQQRLQDLWVAKRDCILNAGATGGRAVRYIEWLLGTGEDFGFRARKKALGRQARPGTPTPSPLATDKPDLRHYWNKKYVGAGVMVTIHGDGSGCVRGAQGEERFVRPADMEPVYVAIVAGKLTLKDE